MQFNVYDEGKDFEGTVWHAVVYSKHEHTDKDGNPLDHAECRASVHLSASARLWVEEQIRNGRTDRGIASLNFSNQAKRISEAKGISIPEAEKLILKGDIKGDRDIMLNRHDVRNIRVGVQLTQVGIIASFDRPKWDRITKFLNVRLCLLA